MLIGSLLANRDRGVVAEEAKAVVTPLVGANPRGDARPPSPSRDGHAPAQTFAVEFRGVGAYAPPHFHAVDQYQVFYAGSGKIGRHRIEKGTVAVHYADRYVSYGPILPDEDDGLAYATVRMTYDAGMYTMPEDRRERLERGGRHEVHHLESRHVRETGSRELIGRHEDGLFAAVLYVGAGERIDEVPPALVSQQLILVDGSVEHRDERLTCPAAIVLAAGEVPTGLVAGPNGAIVLALHFPSPDRALPAMPEPVTT